MKIYRKIDGNKIQCIKDIREVFSLSLREAKDLIDVMDFHSKPVDMTKMGWLCIPIVTEDQKHALRNYGFCISEDYEIKMDDALFKI